LSPFRAERFIQTLSMTPEEVNLFKEKFKNNKELLDYIAYYQEQDKEVFNRKKGR